MLQMRLLTAGIGIPLLLVLFLLGSERLVFSIFFVFVAATVYEMASMFLPALHQKIEGKQSKPIGKSWIFFCVLCSVVLFALSAGPYVQHGRGGIVVGLVFLLMVSTFSAPSLERSIVNMAGSVLSVTYGCLPWISMWELYQLGPQGRYVILLLVIVFHCDSGAYFVGRAWGRRKLAPALSPNKTWEGVLGGIVVAMLGVLLLHAIYGFTLAPWWLLLLAAVLGSIAGVMGDLVESAFKRFSGVKDSGALLPGHGGILDRVDALLFAAPVVWAVLSAYRC